MKPYAIGYLPGCFDILHIGHRNILRRARESCDMLIVGVLTDDGAAAYKRRPIQSETTRLGNVRDLRYVDLAVLQPSTDPTSTLYRLVALGLKPDALFHGDDWQRLKQGQESLERLGIEFVLLPYTHGVSTTTEIERLQKYATGELIGA